MRAERFCAVSCLDDLSELYQRGEFENSKVLILSEGSNILFVDHIHQLVLHNEMWGKRLVAENDDFVMLKVNAGESWSLLVDYVVKKGWGGMENLALIPGKVGASPIQNIGAYGAEARDVISEIEAFDLQSGEVRSFSNDECKFGYRTSIFKTDFKDRFFITSVVFKLAKHPVLNLSYQPLQIAFGDRKEVTLEEVRDEVVRIRRSKLPDTEKFPNAGSFFKNPVVSQELASLILKSFPSAPVYPQPDGTVKIAAGWLIEQCGYKGKRKGDVGVHPLQALVLVNYGLATGQEVL